MRIGASRDDRLNFTGTGGVYLAELVGGVARPDVPLVRLRRFFSSATPEG